MQPGQIALVAAGARAPLDGDVTNGTSQVDASLATGETLPKPIELGSKVFAGTLTIGVPFYFKVTATVEDTLLAEIVRLMEAAEQGRAKYVQLADRFACAYELVVHILALAIFLGWLVVAGQGLQPSLMVAISIFDYYLPLRFGSRCTHRSGNCRRRASTERYIAKGSRWPRAIGPSRYDCI